jgi:AraC-like DNA-binding protein
VPLLWVAAPVATTSTDRISLTSFRERLDRVGVDLEVLARDAGIAPQQLLAHDGTLRTAEYFALFRALERQGGADVGLRLAARADSFSLAGHAALSSPTLGEGLARLSRYKRLTCPEEITIVVARDEARIRLEWLLADDDPPAPLVDTVFAGIVELARHGTGTALGPLRIELARERAQAAVLRRHFGCEIVFDAPIDQLVFPASSLSLPLVTADTRLLAAIDPKLESALGLTGRARGFVDQVRVAVCHRMTGERPTVARIAKDLALSARTLQRRLQDDGTSYQEVLDDVRLRTARRLLSRTRLRAEEIAFLLGFDEFNSFTRAFRTWEGVSPNGWRARRPVRARQQEAIV